MKLKLGQKLISTFVCGALLTAVVGGYALVKIIDIGGLTHNMYVNNLVAMQHLGAAVSKFVVHSRAATRMPTQSPNDVADTMERAQKHWEVVQQELAAYRSTELSAQENTLLKEIDTLIPQYLDLGKRVMKEMQANNIAEAARVSNNDLRVLSTRSKSTSAC
jgi:methyl-accepting chemotaxis protein